MRQFFIATLFLTIFFQSRAQEVILRENILWPAVIVTKDFKESPWSAQLGVQNRYLDFGQDYQLLVGLAYLRHTFKKTNLTLASGFIAGDVPTGSVFLFQSYLLKTLPKNRLEPTFRLTFDHLWFGQGRETGLVAPTSNTRYRLFLGISPKLTRKTSWIVNTEPFLYQSFGFLKEVRSTTGLRFEVTHFLSINALYWHRWLNNGNIELWENALWIIIQFNL